MPSWDCDVAPGGRTPVGVVKNGMPNKNRQTVVKRGDVGGSCSGASPIVQIYRSTHAFRRRKCREVRVGQAKLVLWDDIKENPPPQMKISPIAAIPHKSKVFRSILDLSFTSVESFMPLPKPKKTPRFSWQNGTSRMVFGIWTVKKGKNITLHTSSHR